MKPSILILTGVSTTGPARALYTVRETQAVLGLSHATIYRLIAAEQLDARKIGSRTVITATSIAAFLEKLPAAPVGTAT